MNWGWSISQIPGFDPDSFVKLGGAVAANIEHTDLRPVGVRVDVQVVEGRDTFAIHDGHILGTDW